MIRKSALSLMYIVAVGSAYAQWTVINLHPAGASSSGLLNVSGGQQAGYAYVGGVRRASLWSGSAASWVDLNPAGATTSNALGGGASQQGGEASFGGAYHAGLWTGTAGSWVDLTPAGATGYTSAYGADGVEQVGVAFVSGLHRASLWRGTATSWVDLSGGRYSDAWDVDSGQQAGSVNISGLPHAGVWRGTANSWVDMHPGGSLFRSGAAAVGGGQQVGTATDTSNRNHASLWSGTADSWVDLSPAGAVQSFAYGVEDGQQVGQVEIGGIIRASLWSGTADSWVDLHQFVPAEFTSSTARGVRHDGPFTYVVGSGYNSTTGRDEALMWIGPAPQVITATSTTLSPGIVVSGTPADLNTSNDVYYKLRPGVVLSSSQSPIVLNASYNLNASTASALSSIVESRAQQTNIRQTIEAFNFSTNSYAQLNQQVLPTTPDTVVTSALSPSASYIGAGNEVRLKISYKAVGPILSYPWQIFIDESTLRFAP